MATRNEYGNTWIATHPGTILRYELEEREISQKDFAAMIGMQKSHLNELIKGKRPVTKSIAGKIENVLGISAVSLVNMQTQYEYDLRRPKRQGRPPRKKEYLTNTMIFNSTIGMNFGYKIEADGTDGYNEANNRIQFCGY